MKILKNIFKNLTKLLENPRGDTYYPRTLISNNQVFNEKRDVFFQTYVPSFESFMHTLVPVFPEDSVVEKFRQNEKTRSTSNYLF